MVVKGHIKENRTGETNYNTFGSKMTIIEYMGSHNMTVEFDSGYTTKATYDIFKKGNIRSPYCKTVCNTGYLGEGKYKCRENNMPTIEYICWHSMIGRCYDKKIQERQPTYIDVTCCEEWHNFQTFAKWFYDNYYKIDGEKMHLDKDILHKGNKIYSPENCVFVPERINELFTKNNKDRGEFPIGVSWKKRQNKFESYYSRREHNKYSKKCLGHFDNIQDAFNTYKNEKEQYIKQVANQYKDKIPKNLYGSMINWEVEITD